MNFFDFFNSDKSKMAMLLEENRRMMHEIANLKQKEILRGDGMSEHKLTRILRTVLAEELRTLSRADLERGEIGEVYTASMRAKSQPNRDAAKPDVIMTSGERIKQKPVYDGRNGNGYQPCETRYPTVVERTEPLHPPREL